MKDRFSELFHKSILIGYGALGQNLVHLLHSDGFHFSYIVDHNIKNKSSSTSVFTDNLNNINKNFLPYLIVIAVQDSHIASVVSQIKNHFSVLQNSLVVHTSASVSLRVLHPLKEKGALIGTFHPMMTFVRDHYIDSLENVLIGISSDNNRVLQILKNFSNMLKGESVIITEENRQLYHLLGVFSSNFLISLMASIEELLFHVFKENTHISFKALEPIINQTIQNFGKKQDVIKALSGPVKRKDFVTISHHVRVLKQLPEHYSRLYMIHTLHLAILNNYSQSEMEKLKKILGV